MWISILFLFQIPIDKQTISLLQIFFKRLLSTIVFHVIKFLIQHSEQSSTFFFPSNNNNLNLKKFK